MRKEVGDVSILVNNAGTAKLDSVMSQSDDTTKNTLDLNTFAPILVSKLIIKVMKLDIKKAKNYYETRLKTNYVQCNINFPYRPTL